MDQRTHARNRVSRLETDRGLQSENVRHASIRPGLSYSNVERRTAPDSFNAQRQWVGPQFPQSRIVTFSQSLPSNDTIINGRVTRTNPNITSLAAASRHAALEDGDNEHPYTNVPQPISHATTSGPVLPPALQRAQDQINAYLAKEPVRQPAGAQTTEAAAVRNTSNAARSAKPPDHAMTVRPQQNPTSATLLNIQSVSAANIASQHHGKEHSAALFQATASTSAPSHSALSVETGSSTLVREEWQRYIPRIDALRLRIEGRPESVAALEQTQRLTEQDFVKLREEFGADKGKTIAALFAQERALSDEKIRRRGAVRRQEEYVRRGPHDVPTNDTTLRKAFFAEVRMMYQQIAVSIQPISCPTTRDEMDRSLGTSVNGQEQSVLHSPGTEGGQYASADLDFVTHQAQIFGLRRSASLRATFLGRIQAMDGTDLTGLNGIINDVAEAVAERAGTGQTNAQTQIAGSLTDHLRMLHHRCDTILMEVYQMLSALADQHEQSIAQLSTQEEVVALENRTAALYETRLVEGLVAGKLAIIAGFRMAWMPLHMPSAICEEQSSFLQRWSAIETRLSSMLGIPAEVWSRCLPNQQKLRKNQRALSKAESDSLVLLPLRTLLDNSIGHV